MKFVYFAWVRERIGRPHEELDVPQTIGTAGDLLAWLKDQGPEYEHALSEPRAVRIAFDKRHVRPDAALAGVSEVALFPPMTGG